MTTIVNRSNSGSAPVRRDGRPGCLQRPDLYQHPLMEEPPVRSAPRSEHEEYAQLRREATAMCANCPMKQTCLYDAVTRHDVTGFAGGTTSAQRRQIRNLLKVEVQPDDFDQLVGARATRRPVSHEEVLRLRNTYPNDSLDVLAMRLGCSLSTVKRHLRRARRGQSPAAKPAKVPPTLEAVLTAYETVTAPRAVRTRSRVA